jgi:hypothetical protein
MATLTSGTTISTGQTIDGAGGSAANKNLNDLVNLATIANVGALTGEIAADAIETGVAFKGVTGSAVAATPALRKLGTGANDAAAGDQVMTADKLKFTATIPISTTNPTSGYLLGYNGTSIIGVAPAAAFALTGTGTVDTAVGSATVTANGGAGTQFQTELKVGDTITVGATPLTRKIIAISSQFSLTVDQAWGALNTNQAFTYVPGVQPRPWNDKTAKSANFSVVAADSGQMFQIDNSGANIVVTLCAASAFNKGDSVGFIKVNEDVAAAVKTITINRAGADTFTDGSTSKVISTRGASLTIVSDGVSKWHIVVAERIAGQTIQSKRVTSSTASAAIGATFFTPLSGVPVNTQGTEVLTTSAALVLTPTSINTKLVIRGSLIGGSGNDNHYHCVAVWNGSTLLGCSVRGIAANKSQTIFTHDFEFYVTSTTVSEITFALRTGQDGGNYYMNAAGTGAAVFGGNLQSWIEVAEVCV